MQAGKGDITVNSRPLDEYFGRETARMIVRQPLETLEVSDKFDFNITVSAVSYTHLTLPTIYSV